jgi:hypothetical protein
MIFRREDALAFFLSGGDGGSGIKVALKMKTQSGDGCLKII